jgi:hypothetical protein
MSGHHTPVVNLKKIDAKVEEGGTLKYKVEVEHAVKHDLWVKYEVKPGSATEGKDYESEDNHAFVKIKAGEKHAEIKVKTIDDKQVEKAEDLHVKINDSWNYKVGKHDKQEGEIKDNDWFHQPKVYIKDAVSKEGDYKKAEDLDFKVWLDKPAHETLRIKYTVDDGTAKAGKDYKDETGWVTFKKGEQFAKIDVDILGDRYKEKHETLYVRLVDNDKVDVKDGEAKGTILNDDYFKWFHKYEVDYKGHDKVKADAIVMASTAKADDVDAIAIAVTDTAADDPLADAMVDPGTMMTEVAAMITEYGLAL